MAGGAFPRTHRACSSQLASMLPNLCLLLLYTIPQLVLGKEPQLLVSHPWRPQSRHWSVWVLGCSTGQPACTSISCTAQKSSCAVLIRVNILCNARILTPRWRLLGISSMQSCKHLQLLQITLAFAFLHLPTPRVLLPLCVASAFFPSMWVDKKT